MTAPRSRHARGAGATNTPWFALIAALSFGVVIAALVSQHAFEMQPCPWCVLQRLSFVLIGLVALVPIAWPSIAVQRAGAFGMLLLASAGIAAALWQHSAAAKSASCNLTLADRIMSASPLDRLLPAVFEARASCADAAVALLGVPYAMWSALAFAICAVVLLRILRRSA